MKDFLKKYGLGIFITIVLLAIQAYSDLKLPEITSSIINVGIQQKGVDSAVPNALRETTYSSYNYLLDNKLDKYYTLIDVNNSDYSEDYKFNKEHSIYVLNDDISKKDLKELEKDIKKPEVLLIMISNAKVYETNEYGMDGITLSHLLESTEDNGVKQLYNYIDEIDESLIDQYSIAAVLAEYESLGFSTDGIQMTYLVNRGLLMIGITLFITGVLIASCYLSGRIASRIAADLRDKVVKKVMSYSNAEYNRFSTASLITRCTNDISQLQNMITMLLRMILYAPIVGTMAFIKVANIDMAWVIGIIVGVIVVCLLIILLIGLPKFKIIQKLIDKINLSVRETLNGLPVIRAFANEDKEKDKFDSANTELYRTNLFINKLISLLDPLLSLIMNGAIIAIYWIGADKISAGTMQVGTLTALITYTIHIIISFLILSMISIMAPRSIISLGRVREVLKLDSSIKEKNSTLKLDSNHKGEIEFRDVSFKYPDGDELVLDNITFTAKKGTTTAIIGSTGCGKSSVINLIPRFFDATGGEVLVDGVNVKDLSLHDLRSVVGVVPQKGLLFNGTIKSNIKFANKNMSDDDMIEAAKVACADEFINKFDDNYDHEISQGGTNVSGGQRQRLAIARAVAKKPEILIFDDSFSALDYKTDATVRKNLAKYCKDTTKIIVAQRVGTVMNADQIIVLDDGKIVGIGTHKELLKNCKVYKEIALSQLREEEL